jgi:hypothetical protein
MGDFDVSHPAEGKALRPLHSPRVVFFELARFRAVGQKASLGTSQARTRPMTLATFGNRRV